MKGAPKHVENVATGSVMPLSVPATFAVYPLKKWYMAISGVNFDIGGKTPKASQVRKMTFFGCPPFSECSMLLMWLIGYDTRVFSVIVPSS